MSAFLKDYLNGRPKLLIFKQDTCSIILDNCLIGRLKKHCSFICIETNQIIPLLWLKSRPMIKMHNLITIPIRCFYVSQKKLNLAQISENPNIVLNPWWVAGFVDGEGCFTVSITKDNKRNTGWDVKPLFNISLHVKDLYLLEIIKKHFGVGKIYKQGLKSAQIRVESIKEIEKK